MNKNSKIIAIVIGIVVLGALAYTQLPKGGPDTMAGMNMPASDTSASSKAYEAAMSGMTQDMMTPLTGKPDLDFVQGMIPHHQGAIDMAKTELQYGKNQEIRTLAEGVVKAQEGEITFMKDWLANTDPSKLPLDSNSTKFNEKAMDVMIKNMMVPYTGDADIDFLKGMIPHHQGAIDMAKVAIQFAKDPALLKLAGDIVSAQEGEIAFMNEWLKKNGK